MLLQGNGEWVMFEADLWNGDSLSRAIFVQLGHCVNTGVQQDSFPAPVPYGKVIFVLQQSFSFMCPVVVYICNGGRRKVDRKGTSAGRIS